MQSNFPHLHNTMMLPSIGTKDISSYFYITIVFLVFIYCFHFSFFPIYSQIIRPLIVCLFICQRGETAIVFRILTATVKYKQKLLFFFLFLDLHINDSNKIETKVLHDRDLNAFQLSA